MELLRSIFDFYFVLTLRLFSKQNQMLVKYLDKSKIQENPGKERT